MSTSDVVKETLNVAGLSTNVYARANLRDKRNSEPVVVLFFLHGRTDSADQADPTARAAFSWAAEKEASSKEASRDFMVVTFVRSHPTEVKQIFSTSSLCAGSTEPRQEDGGPTREPGMEQESGVDMYSTLIGAVKDVSFLIDVLPSYVFPHDERIIGEWVLAGFSLGGHATWLGLSHEPRIRIGIPICGCVDYLTMMEQRAERLGKPRTPPFFPKSLRALVRAYDPVVAPPGAFAGKRILALVGADDTLVPWSVSRVFVEALDVGTRGKKRIVVQPGVQHEYTDEMREELFQFFWEEALIAGKTRSSAL